MPDFERLDGTIEGFPLPLTGGPYVNEGSDYNDDGITDFLNVSFEYYQGSGEQHRELNMFIDYIPVTDYLYAGGLAEFLSRNKLYSPGGSHMPSALDNLRENPKDREILVEDDMADRFTNTWYLGSYGSYWAWWGQRLLTYREHYYISIDAVGAGWGSDEAFLQALDMAEKYARDSIDSLAGGITLTFNDPFTFLKAGGGYDHRPAGDLIASITDENGKPVRDRMVVFYVEQGSTLENVMLAGSAPGVTVEMLGGDALVLGSDVTDKTGKAYQPTLWPVQIDAGALSAELKKQRFLYDEKGTVSGTVFAAAIDADTGKVLDRASVYVEFPGLAKIVRITGEGRSDDFKASYLKEFPDSGPWGSGAVRVKRSLVLPTFDYTEVSEGFILMPGDIVDIDGGVEVEIVWVTGDRAIARVPDKIDFGDTEIRPPHARMILSTSSYDSGFQSTWDKIEAGIFGFSVGQGLDVLSGVHPVATGVKKSVEFVASVYDAIKEADFTGQNLMIKVRIRSVIRIDHTGEDVVVQTYEGSPDVVTASGDTATLGQREMVTAGLDGTLGEVTIFNAKNDTPSWFETATAWEDASVETTAATGDSGGGVSVWLIIGVTAVVLVGGGGFILLRRKT